MALSGVVDEVGGVAGGAHRLVGAGVAVGNWLRAQMAQVCCLVEIVRRNTAQADGIIDAIVTARHCI